MWEVISLNKSRDRSEQVLQADCMFICVDIFGIGQHGNIEKLFEANTAIVISAISNYI